RVSADVAYYRRWYGNFPVQYNQNVTAANFTAFNVTAPADPRLPNGGGQVITGVYDLNPAQFGQPAQLYNTLSDKIGNEYLRYDFIDVSVSARRRAGLTLQGGTSTGRMFSDNCGIVAV